jgi:hypothetical protein
LELKIYKVHGSTTLLNEVHLKGIWRAPFHVQGDLVNSNHICGDSGVIISFLHTRKASVSQPALKINVMRNHAKLRFQIIDIPFFEISVVFDDIIIEAQIILCPNCYF